MQEPHGFNRPQGVLGKERIPTEGQWVEPKPLEFVIRDEVGSLLMAAVQRLKQVAFTA